MEESSAGGQCPTADTVWWIEGSQQPGFVFQLFFHADHQCFSKLREVLLRLLCSHKELCSLVVIAVPFLCRFC